MNKIKLAIIEDNPDLCHLLSAYIEKNYSNEMEVVGYAHDGRAGLDLIHKYQPHVALIDVMLPLMDGLLVLEKIRNNPETTHITCIMLSSMTNVATTTHAQTLGADYYCVKPFEYDALVERIIQVHFFKTSVTVISAPALPHFSETPKEKTQTPAEQFTVKMLKQIGMPTHLKGYTYIKKGIVLSIGNPALLEGLTKQLYPSIAKEYKTSWQKIERSIRHAVDKTWSLGCGENYYALAQKEMPNELHKKPASGKFIIAIVDFYNESIS